MKLSEAIRLGATLRPQGYSLFADGTSCAMGAALEAMGHPYEDYPWSRELIQALNDLVEKSKWAFCPECAASNATVFVIEHLNDTHRWTRERIADWVATVEPQETAHDLQPLADQDLLNLSHSQATVAGGMDK